MIESRPFGSLSLRILLLLWLSGFAVPINAQERRPEVHSEFAFGSFPDSREGAALFESAEARMLVAAFDRGWSLDKFLSETDLSALDTLNILDGLEQADLVRGPNDFELRPGLLMIRESELSMLRPRLEADAGELVEVIRQHWREVESFVASLDAGADTPVPQLLYSAMVGGVLTGAMVEVLREDGTLVPAPPRRGRSGDAYYAWMIEGAGLIPPVRTRSDRVGRYTVYSVGTGVEENLRIQIEALRSEGPVFEPEDAERWRVFSSLFARDHLFPLLKSKRSGLLDLHRTVRSAGYAAFAEFAAWYYQELVSQAVGLLVAGGELVPPESSYKYAIRTGR
jgi:hypothetical protein